MIRVRTWCIFALCLIFAAAGFVCGNIAERAEQKMDVSADRTIGDPFENFRRERQYVRQIQVSQLNEIIRNSNTESEILALAERQLMEILKSSDRESAIENHLLIRGFNDLLVSVHADGASIFLRNRSISDSEAAIILECVTRETGISGGNVKIIQIN